MATVFIHIPKTAGTTLTELLLKNYKSSEVEHISEGGKKSAGFLKERALEKSCIFGHFRYYDELRTPDNFLFTFLRNPVDRFISNFFHSQREGNYKAQSLPEAMDLFLQEENLKLNGNWNAQTYFLAGTQGRKFFKNDEEHHVNLAIQRLEQLDFIGITERFEESVYMLGQSLGWKKWYYLHQNVNQRPDDKNKLLQQFRKSIEEANILDQQVYEAGLKIFEKQKSLIKIPSYKVATARALSKAKKLLS